MLKKKLSSRKFWIGVSGIVAGILMMFGFADSSAEVISGAIVTVGSAVGYMIAEGKADSANIGKVFEGITEVIEEVEKPKKENA